MDSPQKADVVDWQDSPPSVIPKARTPRRILPPTLIGVLGTLLLHALVIQSVPWGRGPNLKPPETPESPDALTRSKADFAERLVLISLPTMPASNQIAAQNLVFSLPDLRQTKIKLPVDVDPPSVLNIEALPLSEDKVSQPTSGTGDGAELTTLFGIYSGQIHVRIDRIWRRPRTPVSENPESNVLNDLSFALKGLVRVGRFPTNFGVID